MMAKISPLCHPPPLLGTPSSKWFFWVILGWFKGTFFLVLSFVNWEDPLPPCWEKFPNNPVSFFWGCTFAYELFSWLSDLNFTRPFHKYPKQKFCPSPSRIGLRRQQGVKAHISFYFSNQEIIFSGKSFLKHLKTCQNIFVCLFHVGII